ncbi:hypothetical protein ACIP69_09900 [Streptomyces hygroscopicus]|uniref:hypothetical protein n=1 Tax=Streptomyces hygroscopicus TaxID=1912 RepID=UPI00380E7D28
MTALIIARRMMDEPPARPFDAAVSLMAEAPASAPSTWSTVSLAKYLRDALFTPPSQRTEPLHDRGKIIDALKALTDRGLDGYAFVRYGLGLALAERIAALASLPQLFSLLTPNGPSGEVDEILESLPEEVTEWAKLCKSDITLILPSRRGSFSPDSRLLNSIMELTHDWHSRVHTWAQQTDIQHLIDWRCPTDDEFNALADSGTPESDLESHYAWVVDRLTETYLSDWEDSSLHHEYRWLKGAAPTPFPDGIMNLRPISPVALNAEIADRAVMHQGDKAQRETVAQLAFQGAQLIKSGNRDAAASTFRLITKIAPEDSNARNDLGFSLVPDEPRKALRHLTTAAKMGYDQPFINAHNRMICNLLIGAPKEALYIAESTWSSGLTEQAVPAIIWSQIEDQWVVRHVPDARIEVAELALQVTQTLGGEAQEAWQCRLASLLPDDAPSDLNHS